MLLAGKEHASELPGCIKTAVQLYVGPQKKGGAQVGVEAGWRSVSIRYDTQFLWA
jgi:hypothetical protein